jgi:hypothetical protein
MDTDHYEDISPRFREALLTRLKIPFWELVDVKKG